MTAKADGDIGNIDGGGKTGGTFAGIVGDDVDEKEHARHDAHPESANCRKCRLVIALSDETITDSIAKE